MWLGIAIATGFLLIAAIAAAAFGLANLPEGDLPAVRMEILSVRTG